ncbi:LysR substrate-binding domain-containing protein, partial [Rhizobium ruizarguesonis]
VRLSSSAPSSSSSSRTYLEIAADDRFVDLIEEGFDVAIRINKLEDSGMIARKISDFRIHICATPEFLERYPDLDHPTALSN